MAIFPYLETEEKLQTNEKTRLSAVKSYISKDEAAITLVEIEPETGSGYVTVTGSSYKDWYLDWEYSTIGTKVVTCRITTDGAPSTITSSITVVTAATENLFSSDSDISQIEKDILKYVPDGKNNFKYMHREAQKQILEWLYVQGYTDYSGDKLTVDAVIDIEEVKFWSKYLVLRLIYQQLSNSLDDIFDKKSKYYENYEHQFRQRSVLKLDVNGDGEATNEGFDIQSTTMVRR